MMPVPSRRPSHSRLARPLAWYMPLCAALPLAVAALPPALADDQSDNAAPNQASAGSGGLEEVVVTATRREESLSKVPISVSALTEADMDARGIKSIDDIARYTPGINVDNNGTNNISIRGISSSGGAGTTGIYIDDTPIQMRSLAFNPDEALPSIFDMDRVEVLRGPQGTLFGAGSEGGTVRYITTQPSLTRDSVLGRAEVDYTQNGAPSFEAGAAVGGPLIDGKLGARLTLWYRKDGGWVDMVNPTAPDPATAIVDSNANHDETYLARLAFLWQVSDHWAVTPAVMFQKRDVHQDGAYWPLYSSGGNFVNADPEVRGAPDTFYLPSLKIEGDLGAFNFISNTSLYHRTEQTGYEGTEYNLSFYQVLAGVPGQYMNANGLSFPGGLNNYRSPASVDNGQQNITQEFRLVSADPNARLVWTAGLFYSQNRQSYLEQIHDPMVDQFFSAALGAVPNGVPGSGGDVGGVPVFYDENGNALGYQAPGVGLNPRGLDPYDSYFLMTHATDEQMAVFGEATYAIVDGLKATVGLRESHVRFTNESVTGGPQLYNTTTAPGPVSAAENSFTPRVSLSWQIDPANMVYATYAKGFRPGGGDNPLPPAACQLPSQTQTPQTYSSDTVDSFEVGAKNNVDNRLKIASSVYYIRWNNIQQQITVPVCEISYIANLGQAVAKGADIQVQWLPFDPLSVDLTMGYTDARFTRSTYSPFPDGVDANGNPTYQLIANNGDAIQSESGYANPPFTLAAGVEYSFRLVGHDSSVRLDYQYQSHDKWPTPAEDPAVNGVYKAVLQLPSTSMFNLHATMALGDLTVEPFIDNLADTRAYTGYDSQDGTGLIRAYTFRPRTFGVMLTYHR